MLYQWRHASLQIWFSITLQKYWLITYHIDVTLLSLNNYDTKEINDESKLEWHGNERNLAEMNHFENANHLKKVLITEKLVFPNLNFKIFNLLTLNCDSRLLVEINENL